MNTARVFHRAPRLLNILVAAFLSTNALAQDPLTIASISARQLGLSNYHYFVIYPHLEKALKAQNDNDEKTALSEFEHIHQQVPDNVVLTLYQAQAYRHFGHDDQARQLLTEQLKRHPQDPRLQHQLDAIPTRMQDITNLDQLLAQQDACDAMPTLHCRSETGQNALKLNQLAIARAQLKDQALANSERGKALENGIAQRAINLKDWQTADAIFSEMKSRNALSPQEQQQWFDVLLTGKLDERLLALQSQGEFNRPWQQLSYASSLAARDEKDALTRYLATHQPRFDNEAQEKNWLYLIAHYSAQPQQALEAYGPQFAANQRYVADAALSQALKTKDYAQELKLLNTLPDDDMLAERYTLSIAMNNHAESLRMARLMYQRSPQNPALLNQLSWQLMQNGQSRDAATLLLQRYPFDGPAAPREKLITRLIGLLQQNPQLLTPGARARLSVPLATPALRALQSELPGESKDCRATRALLDDMSTQYDATTWDRLADCYRQDLPGLALYALQHAEQRHPIPYQHRATAYQAYAVEDYATAMQAWNALTLADMTNQDLMAAANTAQVANDFAARDRWLDAAQQRGLDNSEDWWWLHAQRYLPDHPLQAIADLNHAIVIEPTVRALSLRAALYRQQGRTADALNDLRQAQAIEPHNAATQAALGYALWSNKAYAASRVALEQALHSTPDDPQIVRQLMYVNERLGDVPRTQRYARQVIDQLDAAAEVMPLTPGQNQERFDARRLHQDIGQRWTFSFDTSIGLSAGTTIPSGILPGGISPSMLPAGLAPGKRHHSYGQLQADYRLGNNMLVDGDTLSVYSRMFADTGTSSVIMPVKDPLLATGLRWKPLHDYVLFFAVEEQFALDHHHGETDTMLRASASLLNNGRFSDEWHPNGNGWFAHNLYLDAAQYTHQDIQVWTADYRSSWHQKIAQNQTIEPYAHVQVNGYRDDRTTGNQLGGIGVRWNIWTGESRYNAWPYKISLGIEYQRTFKAVNQDIDKRNNTFLTLGIY